MKTIGHVLAAALTSGGLPSGAWAQDRSWDWAHPMWGAWGVGMLVVMLTFWVLVIVALFAGIRWLIHLGREPGREPRRDPAVEILRERYARGEIGKEEFDAKKRDLT
jgi:putative membrane protein